MSWYRPWNGLGLGAVFLIAVDSAHLAANEMRLRYEIQHEEWRDAYRNVQTAADTDGDGRLDPVELEDIRTRLSFRGEFGLGTLISGPQPPKEALERVLQTYNQGLYDQQHEKPDKQGPAASITSK